MTSIYIIIVIGIFSIIFIGLVIRDLVRLIFNKKDLWLLF